MITIAKIALICVLASIAWQQNRKPTVTLDYQLNKELILSIGLKQTCILPGGVRVDNKVVLGPF